MMDLKQFSLEGKVAIVTGASRGIGRITALAFAKVGADVVLASRKVDDLEKVAADIRKEGRKALVVGAHLGKMEEVKKVADAAKATFGKIDILVNNAGTSPSLASFLETEERLWNTVIDLNLKGMFFMAQAVAKLMKDQKSGCIINVASIDGFSPELNQSVYCISKAGGVMATKAMARELAPYNIRVNALAPGFVHTKMFDSSLEVIPGREQKLTNETPLGRLGQPEDMVGTMIYLASDASRWTTGHTFIVDGGMIYI